MAVRLVCRKCGKRLKLPEGQAVRSAKCPKCLAPVDLTAAREVSAYKSAAAVPRPAPPLLGAGDPLPTPPRPPITVTKPIPPPKTVPPPKTAGPPKPIALLGADDPLPVAPPERTGGLRPPLAHSETNSEASGGLRPPLAQTEVLSLDDDPPDPAAPVEVVPFRVPVRVLADSHAVAVGPCVAVLLPHGLFLEHEPMKPFLYAPPGVRVDSPAPGELTLALPEGRTVTFRFQGRSARPLARDTRAFLAGTRPVPVAADYRRKWWMLWAALIFALGLTSGPLVLSQTAELGFEFGLQVGAGFALVGFFANSAIVVFSRRPIFVQMLVMAGVCVLVTGVFLFAATAYLAGRQKAGEQTAETGSPNPGAPTPGVNTPGSPVPGAPGPGVPDRPPSHIDLAKKNGFSAFKDETTDVTALALAPDGNTLGIGHADGTTQLWKLDQPTFEAALPGPKADGPVTRVQFDTKGRFLFVYTATGVIAAPQNGAPAAPAKLPGAPVAVASELEGDRIRFAAIRGNSVVHRLIDETFVIRPPKADKYALPGKGDEITPAGITKDPTKPAGATIFAWAPGGRLYAGQPDGSIAIWSLPMRAEAPSRDHKTAVKVWAECPVTGDFATGDDQGNVGIWSSKGGKPTVASVVPRPVTGLSFSPSGARLAVIDDTGRLVIWNPVAGKAIEGVRRMTTPTAVAFGPGEDILILATGRTVEVWTLAALAK